MPNRDALDPRLQLGPVVHELPPMARFKLGDVCVAHAPTMRFRDRSSVTEAPTLETVPVEFRRDCFPVDGVPVDGWVYDGPLLIDPNDFEVTADAEQMGEWLRTRIGPCCVRLRVQRHHGEIATVTAYLVPTAKA